MPLFSDYLFHVILFQADLVMLSALTACMCANIITVAEGLSGFANEGVLTVVVSKLIHITYQIRSDLLLCRILIIVLKFSSLRFVGAFCCCIWYTIDWGSW